jgi:hypothetical protein
VAGSKPPALAAPSGAAIFICRRFQTFGNYLQQIDLDQSYQYHKQCILPLTDNETALLCFLPGCWVVWFRELP